MVLDNLGTSLKNTLKKLVGASVVDEALINEIVKDIQRALLQADVNVKLVFALTNAMRERITKEKTPAGLTKREHLVHIVYEELTSFLGGEQPEIEISGKPTKFMLVGLFGSGKTTTCAKLAKYYLKRGKKVALVGLDVWRPAAMAQLEQLASQLKIPCFVKKGEKDPIKIYDIFVDKYKDFDLLIIDTAGRDAVNEELITEIKTVAEHVKADHTFLVISADIGQAAQDLAQKFHDTCGVTSVISTKMDGTAKAGGALSACAVTEAPIRFIGVGEKIDDFERFNAKGFVGRLLGMGDLEALLEKAQGAMSEDKAEEMAKRMTAGEFNLIDLYEQMNALKGMGSMQKLMEMIPGMGQLQLPKEVLDVQEGKLEVWKHIMDSCTKKELMNPDEISADRIARIAKGSGTKETDIREMLKQYKNSKKLFKMMKSNPEDLMKQMQGGKMTGKAARMFKKMRGKR
ncbi:MAG TPA: signal recognition particle protein Srp54 [Candidatus Nanoarchaeia archaeon]|nr:signal recognition particle protein Srp54 [Candidatus Nanoarchaeia archaeon]